MDGLRANPQTIIEHVVEAILLAGFGISMIREDKCGIFWDVDIHDGSTRLMQLEEGTFPDPRLQDRIEAAVRDVNAGRALHLEVADRILGCLESVADQCRGAPLVGVEPLDGGALEPDRQSISEDEPDTDVPANVVGEQERSRHAATEDVEPAGGPGEVVQGELRGDGRVVTEDEELAHAASVSRQWDTCVDRERPQPDIDGPGSSFDRPTATRIRKPLTAPRPWIAYETTMAMGHRSRGDVLAFSPDRVGNEGAAAMEMIEVGRRVDGENPVCDVCLGRIYADRSFGLTNRERGRAIRVVVAMLDDEPMEPIDESCWVCEGHTERYNEWADRVIEALEGIEFETYQVGTRVPPLLEENDRLLREAAGVDVEAGEAFKSDMNREVGKRVGRETGTTVDFERPDVLALLELERGTVEVQVNPAFVYGRYRKLERDIPQTEWPCSACGGSGTQLGPDGEEPCEECGGSGYRYETSVEGLTVPAVVEAMRGEEGVFHGAGREDVDARMVGTGRPFVIEVKRPRDRSPDLETLQRVVNDRAAGRVEVEGLRLATHEMVERVKTLEASKVYRMTVEFDEPVAETDLEGTLAELEGTTVEQRTPNRVAHRRADAIRERTVYEADGDLLDPRHAELRIHGEGGLYVKELVSGDDGRTRPSLAGTLGVGAIVTSLDVLAVEGESAAFDDPAFLKG